MTDASRAEAAVAEAHRREWARVLASTVRTARDLDLAEECVQEAYAEALVTWARDGIPDNPGAWLTTTARRRALDAIRREARLRPKLALLMDDDGPSDDRSDGAMDAWDPSDDASTSVPDDRLRLIFMCCHPALAPEAQVALTLRLVCGMATADIAKALLVSEPTMAARLTRAKRKIAVTRIPVRVPATAELPDRLETVLGVIYLLFTTGHTAPGGSSLVRVELVDESLRLARLLYALMPDEREVAGLLGLLVAIDARRATRVSGDGQLVRLRDQDRTVWDRAAIDEARGLVTSGLRGGRPGRFALQAAIASLHAEAPSYDATDWHQILSLYDALYGIWPSPVVALNRAVALAMVAGPASALDAVVALEADNRLADYHYLYAVKAHLLDQLGRTAEAVTATRRAEALADNDVERDHLHARNATRTTSTARPRGRR